MAKVCNVMAAKVLTEHPPKMAHSDDFRTLAGDIYESNVPVTGEWGMCSI